MTIYLSSRYFIPKEELDRKILKRSYAYRSFDDEACKRCKVFKAGKRYNPDKCHDCESYLGVVKLWKEATLKGKKYIGLPTGNPKRIEAKFGIDLSKAKDHRAYVPMEAKLKLKLNLYTGDVVRGKQTANQKQIVADTVKALLETGAGIIQSPPRTGKCVHGSTIISTNKGIMPIKELFDGYSVEDGTPYPVETIKILTEQGYRKVSHLYKKVVDNTIVLNTDSGNSIHGTYNHPVLVLKPNLSHEWVNLEDVNEGDYLCRPFKNQNIKGKEINNDIAWILGCLIANGCLHLSTKSFTSENRQVLNKFVSVVKSALDIDVNVIEDIDKSPRICCNEVVNRLISYGLDCVSSSKKRVPDYIMRANEEGVLAFLNGYLSCDSYIKGKNEVELCTASSRLAKELHVIMSRLGMHGKLDSYTSYARNSANPKNKRYFSLYFNGPAKEQILNMGLFKESSDYNFKNDHKYLTYAIPHVRDALIDFIRSYGNASGWYEFEGKKIQVKIPFGGSKGKNRVSRSHFLNQNWDKVSFLIRDKDPELWDNIERLRLSEFLYVRVNKKTHIKNPLTVYDVSVPETESFVGNGLVVHNTLMAVAVAVELQQRAVIFANKDRLLKQFKGTIEGDDKYPAATNAIEESERLDRPVVCLVEKPSDLEKAENADIVLVLYQKFIREGSIDRIYDFIVDRFGLAIIDEVHRGSSNGFAKLLSRINTAYRLGLSATPKNKKKTRRLVLNEYMGTVVAKSESVSMPTRIEVVETGITISKPHRLWIYAIKYLCSKFERNKLIVQEVFKDLRAGRQGILIPVQFKAHIQELTDMINNQADYNNRNKKEDWPLPLCVPYTGAIPESKKEEYLNAFDKGKIKVMVSINSMITEGVDLANPDTLYQVIPMSGNEEAGAPIFQQLAFRVSTFTETKVDPVIKVFVDALPQSFYCFRSLMTHEVFPRLGKEYRMGKYDLARAKEIIDEVNQSRGYIPPNPAGKRIFSKEVVQGVDTFGTTKVKATHKKKKKTIDKDGLRKLW